MKSSEALSIDEIAQRLGLATHVLRHRESMRAFEPVLEFDMADPRVIDPIDVMSEIDRRPNLLDYTPTDFEHFIQNLFAKMSRPPTHR